MFDSLVNQNITATSFVYSLTRPAGVYSFKITPLHGLNKSSQSKSINVQIPVAGAPSNLTSTYDASCNVILNWDVPSNNTAITATSYNIYDASNTLIVSTAALSYTFQNQVCGQSFAYTVKSVHGSFIGSGASTSVAVPVPAPAVSVVSAFDTTGAISLTWNYPQTMVNIDNFAIFDIVNNVLSPSIPASPSTANYFFSMGNSFPLGASYSFYVLSYNKGVASQASIQTTVALPVPGVPLSFVALDNPTTPPNASLSWLPPSNNNIISTDSYNVYQDGMLVHNVVQPTFNTDALVASQTYSFVVKPLHGSVEFNSPASFSLMAYQPSSVPMSFLAQPKNNSVVLSWQNPANTGGLAPNQFNLSYVADNGQTIQANIMYSTTGAYSQTITGLTNKTSYNFNLFFMTGFKGGAQLNGQVSTISATPTGFPLITSIQFASKTLTAVVDGNGSALTSNFIIVSYDSSNIPTVNQYTTPATSSNGMYSIVQLMPANAVKCTLIVSNAMGITAANSW
jgi:Fibronectin type III domain